MSLQLKKAVDGVVLEPLNRANLMFGQSKGQHLVGINFLLIIHFLNFKFQLLISVDDHLILLLHPL